MKVIEGKKGMIHQIGDLLIDVREVTYIGSVLNDNGFRCGVFIGLKSGERIFAVFKGVDYEEMGLPQKLIDRANKEVNELKELWMSLA